MDVGERISFEVLQRGTAVYSSDEVQVGKVAHVLAAEDEDVFDGIIISEIRWEGSIGSSTPTRSTRFIGRGCC